MSWTAAFLLDVWDSVRCQAGVPTAPVTLQTLGIELSVSPCRLLQKSRLHPGPAQASSPVSPEHRKEGNHGQASVQSRVTRAWWSLAAGCWPLCKAQLWGSNKKGGRTGQVRDKGAFVHRDSRTERPQFTHLLCPQRGQGVQGAAAPNMPLPGGGALPVWLR